MAYRIRNWEEHYETSDTRKLVAMSWVKIPNQQDSLAYRMISRHKSGSEIFAAWILMVQVASRGRRGQRGLLPYTPEELSIITGFPAKIFALAIDFLKTPQIAWIEAIPGNLPASPENLPTSPGIHGKPPGRMEGKRMEQKERTLSPLPPTLISEFLRAYPRERFRKQGGEGVWVKVKIGEKGKAALVEAMISRPEYPWVRAARFERAKAAGGTARDLLTFLSDLPAEEELPPEPKPQEPENVREETPEEIAEAERLWEEAKRKLQRVA